MENSQHINRGYRFAKRLFDVFFSLIMIIVMIPTFLLVSLWIFIVSPGPVLFFQKRYGRHGRFFWCIKFRTMNKKAPHNLPTWEIDAPWQYYIAGGGFLRRFGIDELPQLWNILLGQMSFVGPRPCGINEADLNQRRQENGAGNFRPGLTGYAQVMNRSCEDNSQKAVLDGFYAANASAKLDWTIFWKTFSVLSHPKKKR
jgi:O-antigen biosynthesis protein WbqP